MENIIIDFANTCLNHRIEIYSFLGLFAASVAALFILGGYDA